MLQWENWDLRMPAKRNWNYKMLKFNSKKPVESIHARIRKMDSALQPQDHKV